MASEMTKCPFCVAENRTSRLTPSPMSSSTCMAGSPGSFDEAGKWFAGSDPNWHTREWWCSAGHRFTVTKHEGDADDVRLISTTQPLTP